MLLTVCAPWMLLTVDCTPSMWLTVSAPLAIAQQAVCYYLHMQLPVIHEYWQGSTCSDLHSLPSALKLTQCQNQSYSGGRGVIGMVRAWLTLPELVVRCIVHI
jgi:hypothetical protein